MLYVWLGRGVAVAVLGGSDVGVTRADGRGVAVAVLGGSDVGVTVGDEVEVGVETVATNFTSSTYNL